MPYTKDRAKGDAVLAGTAGATFGAPLAIRNAEEVVRPKLVARNQAQQEKVRAQYKKAPNRGKTAGTSFNPRKGTTHKVERFVAEDKDAKAKRIAGNKKVAGQLNSLQRRAKGLNKPFYRNQTKMWAGSMAVGLPATMAANRYRDRKIHKREKGVRRSDAAVLGGFAGGALYQGTSLAVKPYEQKKFEAKIKKDPRLKAKQSEHRSKTMPKNAPTGHKAWKEYSRSYPKELPGAKLRRLQARTHAGKSGVLATMGAAALGSVAATSTYDSRTKVRKSAFGVEHG